MSDRVNRFESDPARRKMTKTTTDTEGRDPEIGEVLDAPKKPGPPAKRPKRSVDAALELKLAGATYAQIARALEWDDAKEVRVAVEKRLADFVDHEADYKSVKATTVMQLDRMIRSMWPRATDANDPEHLAYVRGVTEVLKRKSALLGLDAPTRLEMSSPDAQEFTHMVDVLVETVGEKVEADIFELEEGDDGVYRAG